MKVYEGEEVRRLYHDEVDRLLDRLEVGSVRVHEGYIEIRTIAYAGIAGWTAGHDALEALINLRQIVDRGKSARAEDELAAERPIDLDDD